MAPLKDGSVDDHNENVVVTALRPPLVVFPTSSRQHRDDDDNVVASRQRCDDIDDDDDDNDHDDDDEEGWRYLLGTAVNAVLHLHGLMERGHLAAPSNNVNRRPLKGLTAALSSYDRK